MTRSETRLEELRKVELLFWKRLSDDVPLATVLETGVLRELAPGGAGAEAERICREGGDPGLPLMQQEETLKRRIATHFRESVKGRDDEHNRDG